MVGVEGRFRQKDPRNSTLYNGPDLLEGNLDISIPNNKEKKTTESP